jgi:hypothetical protein
MIVRHQETNQSTETQIEEVNTVPQPSTLVLKEEKRPAHRPLKYDSKYCQEMLEYFDIEPYFEREIVATGKNGYEKIDYKRFANDLPTLGGFAAKIGVDRATLKDWADRFEDFSRTYEKCTEIAEHILVTNGLQGLYQSNFAVFVATNYTKMRDKKNTELTGKDGEALPAVNFISQFNYVVPKDRIDDPHASTIS